MKCWCGGCGSRSESLWRILLIGFLFVVAAVVVVVVAAAVDFRRRVLDVFLLV
ncbi:hypothetical protein HanRHA438_Chr17g0832681 [Helianthus annuus]|nr:hypothetical protein HanRHA438_Chr17g0832681 [Helianthus annuus]